MLFQDETKPETKKRRKLKKDHELSKPIDELSYKVRCVQLKDEIFADSLLH